MKDLALNNWGVQELNAQELKEIDGGDKADKFLAVCGMVGLAMVGAALVATGPVGIAVGIMGSSLGVSTTVASAVKALASKD